MNNSDSIKHITIVCEGSEEYDYLDRLIQLGVFHENYKIKLKNANGIDNIFPIYQNEFQSGSSELVLVLCDTEVYPMEQYKTLKIKIDMFHAIDGISKEVVFFANPCTMQIVLSHFDSIRLKTSSKSKNGAYIEKYTGVHDYHAKKKEREAIMRKLDINNYNTMKGNISKLSNDDTVLSSTNFGLLLNGLERSDGEWVDELANRIDS